jgi:hypothetical protein
MPSALAPRLKEGPLSKNHLAPSARHSRLAAEALMRVSLASSRLEWNVNLVLTGIYSRPKGLQGRGHDPNEGDSKTADRSERAVETEQQLNIVRMAPEMSGPFACIPDRLRA